MICSDLPALRLPSGTTAQGVIEAQHAHILTLEEQIRVCAK